MKLADTQCDFALEIVRTLRNAGYEALWAGGCVRDRLLGIEPKDYDVATSARPEQIRDLFGTRRTLAIGAAFGVIGVLGRKSQDPIEVATFRADGDYLDGRHPSSVSYTDAEHDAQRRDFTINGLFYDPLNDQVIDYVQGQRDLAAGIVRAIRNPRDRFTEDKLRMLRAVRFAATFAFEIEPETLAAMCEMAAEVKTVSAERIGMELRRMLVHEQRHLAVELLETTGLLGWVLPCLSHLDDAVLQRTRETLARLRDPGLPLALAVLLRNLDEPALGASVARQLRYTNKEGERTQWLLDNVERIGRAQTEPWPTIQRLLVDPGAAELVALHESLRDAGPDAATSFCREKLALPAEQLNPLPLLDGSDLIQHGIQPGPQFAVLLHRLRDAQLEGALHSREDAIQWLDQWQHNQEQR